MDKKDLQILELLDKNCRLSNTTIAKALNLSKDTVKNRIQIMEKEKTITHYNTILDLRPLGILKFHVLLKFKEEITNKEEIINKVMKQFESASFINSFIGKYDLQIIIDTKDAYSFESTKSELFQILGNSVRDSLILTYIHELRHKNMIPDVDLDTKFEKKADSSFSAILPESIEAKREYSPVKIDELDLKIIDLLCENPRITLVELERKLKYNRETIKQRIINLLKKKLITNFGANPSFEKFNYVTYFFMIKLNETIPEKILNKTVQGISNIYYSAKMQGQYNMMAYVLAKSPQQLKDTIKQIQQGIGQYIENTEILLLDELYLYKQLPNKTLKELKSTS